MINTWSGTQDQSEHFIIMSNDIIVKICVFIYLLQRKVSTLKFIMVIIGEIPLS